MIRQPGFALWLCCKYHVLKNVVLRVEALMFVSSVKVLQCRTDCTLLCRR
jgi:hypothetical protein